MSPTLDELRTMVLAYASDFDPASLTPVQADGVVRVCAQIEASVVSMRVLAAARSAEGSAWKAQGHRSAADKLAHDAGTSPSAAKRDLATGRRMSEQPTVAAAALAGALSPRQAEAVCDGVAADPQSAEDLITKARQGSLAELDEEVARVKAAAVDQEERRRAIHAKRSFRRWTDRDGAFQAHLFGQPGDGAGLWRMLDPVRRRLNLLRNLAGGERESLDALDYDALMIIAAVADGRDGELGITDLLDLGLFPQLNGMTVGARSDETDTATADATRSAVATETSSAATSDVDTSTAITSDIPASAVGASSGADESAADTFDAASPAPADQVATSPDQAAEAASEPRQGQRVKKLAGSPAQVMIRVDLDALLRGVSITGELCEIAGYGPVPVSVIEELIANENPFIVGILTKGKEIVGVYHHGRRPSAHQKSALNFLYPTCAVAGCNARAGLQYDHREDWAKTKFTVYDLLDRLCSHHHGLKTRSNWGLVAGVGKRRFVPPGDPDHPAARSRRSSEAPRPGRSP